MIDNNYYQKKYITVEMVKETINRDFSALGKRNANIRALRVSCLFDLERALKLINWSKNRQNLYLGCSKLKEIPNFTFNTKKRSESTSEWYMEKYDKLVYESDLFIDLDGNLKDTLTDLNAIKELFDDHKIPYQVIASGSRGFHVVIDGKYMPIKKIERGRIYPHKDFIERLKQALNLGSMDLANNSLTNHLRKVPYSLVYPKDKDDFTEDDMNIALPLSDAQIDMYTHSMINKNNILSKVKIFKRGTLERFQELTPEEKKKNVITLLNEFFCKV